MKEYHATRVPTLLVGIGGIGGKIVQEVNKSLREFDKSFVKMICLDTDTNDLGKVDSQNIPYIQTSENQTVGEYLKRYPEYLRWFPSNPLINSKNLTQGAGQMRFVSRLGALASEQSNRFEGIKDAINQISKNKGVAMCNMIRVMIVGSMCGGTGSGLGIQLPFLIREQIEELSNMPRVIIRGLFLAPELMAPVQDTDAKKDAMYVNGYAFLKELNGFYKAQTFTEGTEKLDIEHYNPPEYNFHDDPTAMAKQVPYDFLFLLEKSDSRGENIGELEDYITNAAQIVRSQLFAGDVTSRIYSSEDNLIISQVEADGMRRYCGAGIAKAVYPEQENIRYCTLRYAESILQDYWLKIDRAVELNVKQHKKQMAVDHSLQPLDPQKEYRNVFDDLTDSNKHDVKASFGMLKRDLVVEVTIKDRESGQSKIETMNHAESLVNSIEDYLKNIFFDANMSELADSCNVVDRQFKDKGQAAAHITGVMNSLKHYEKEAEKRVGNLTAACVESIIASNIASALNYDDANKNPYSLYPALKEKHPIIVRYILYYLKEALLVKAESLKVEISKIKKEDNLFSNDYYIDRKNPDNKAKEDPATAITLTNMGWLSSLEIYSSDYMALKKRITTDVNAYKERILNLSNYTLAHNVYSSVVKRINMLIAQYETYFKELESVLRLRQKERANLEDNQPRIIDSNLRICCDKTCKEWLYSKFDEQIKNDEGDLSTEVKKTFFDALFNEYAKDLEKETSSTAFVEAKLSVESLFENAILNPMLKEYEDTQFAHLKMNIIEAIHLEYQIHKQHDLIVVEDPNYAKSDYFVAVCRQLKELSRPHLTYTNARGATACYWGINNKAVCDYQHVGVGDVNKSELKVMFGESGDANFSPVNDDSFDPRELTCYSCVYDFAIENLPKYEKGKKCFAKYSERLKNIADSSYRVGMGADDYLSTVHPHLDVNWHKHSYLPELMDHEEETLKKDIIKAFLLAVACKYCRYLESDETVRWAFRQDGENFYSAMTLGNLPATRATYLTLYRALDENSVVVNGILSMDASSREKEYSSVSVFGIDLPTLLNQPVIKGFIGRKLQDDEKEDLQKAFDNNENYELPINILDVIFTIYKDSHNVSLVDSIVKELIKYLLNYCKMMTNNQPGLSKRLCTEICAEIGKNFSSKAPVEFTTLISDFI